MPAPRKVFRAVAETVEYDIVLRDDTTITVKGYKKNGAPLDIVIAYDRAIRDNAAEAPTAEERGDPGDPTADPPRPPKPGTLSRDALIDKTVHHDRLLRRDMLKAVIPELASMEYADEVNVLASDDGPIGEIMIDLGWWRGREEVEDDGGPEVPASRPIGPDGSPDSSPSTTSTPSGGKSAAA